MENEVTKSLIESMTNILVQETTFRIHAIGGKIIVSDRVTSVYLTPDDAYRIGRFLVAITERIKGERKEGGE